ncbi:19468_t:CDS:2, partial [Gigaspora rosea]
QNLSAPKNYDCVATGECIVGECEPCDKLDSLFKCKWNGTPKNGNNLPDYRPCRQVKRLERANSSFIAFISCAILIAGGYRRLDRRIG